MQVSAPRFRWEWNVNTVAVLVGFASGFVAWGYTLSELRTGRATNAANIERISGDVKRLDEATRRLDAHDMRITVMERQQVEASSQMRAVEQSMNSLASDMRLTREILERLERSTNGRPTRN